MMELKPKEPSWKEQAKEMEIQDRKRRRREITLIIILVGIFLIAFALELYFSWLAQSQMAFPFLSGALFFASLYLVLMLALVVIFLAVRNIVKLIFESRKGIFGAHLRTRLIIAFISLSLAPATVLFGLSNFYLSFSVGRWFDPAISGLFNTSRDIVNNTYQMVGEDMLHFARNLSQEITEKKLLSSENFENLKSFLEQEHEKYALDGIEVFDGQGELIHRVLSENLSQPPEPSEADIKKVLAGYEGYFIEPLASGELIRGKMPVFSSWEKKRNTVGAIMVSRYLAQGLVRQLDSNLQAYQDYERLAQNEPLIQRQHFTILVLVTLVVLFLSIWFGLYIAKGITGPIRLLAEGTQEVASGNLDYRIEMDTTDEIGVLVRSFNKMTGDLKQIRQELEQRRIYIETVLADIDSGVIATDPEGKILTVNQPALLLLSKKKEELINNYLNQALPGGLAKVIEDIEKELEERNRRTAMRQIFYQTAEQRAYLRISLSQMRDSASQLLGKVVLIDDLTDLVRAQRSMAWKEVARRMAHEIKNPLTPIQLSAQRLLRKYEAELGERAEVLRECTSMIINQVEEIKRLADEFFSYARLPGLKLGNYRLNQLLEETLALFQPGHPQIEFKMELDPNLPEFEFDRDQIKRAIINLVDNAIKSLEEKAGLITISSSYLPEANLVKVMVADTGKGIPEEERERIFEPYYSTRASGTGLGLAIVQRIISDHQGRILVEPNLPKGTKFIIELSTRLNLPQVYRKEASDA